MFKQINIKPHYFLLLLLSFLLIGCSSVTNLKTSVTEGLFGRDEPNAPRELTEITPTVKAEVLWKVNVGEAGNFEFSPRVESGSVYAASAEGTLTKVDADSGKTQWQLEVGEPISGGVGSGGGLILVGTKKGALYAYNVDGEPQWKSNLSSEILSQPEYFDEMIIVRTGDSKIYGINSSDGSRKWVYDRTSPALTLRSSAGVLIDGGAVYAGYAGGKLIAIRADNGELLWEAAVAKPQGVTEIERISDITSLPAVDGPIVYAVAYQGKVAGVDRRTGQVVWDRAISSLNGLSMEYGRIYIAHAFGAVYSLDSEKGKSYWRQGAFINRQVSTPLPMDTHIAVGDVEGYIHLLNQDSGEIDGRVRVSDEAIMPKLTLLNDDTLLAQSRDGVVAAVKIIK